MAFMLSPGVLVRERDLTTIVPQVATTGGAFVGPFSWGPVDEPVLVDSEDSLRKLFGNPADGSQEHWFSAANFLAYGNNLRVVRVIDAAARTASVSGAASPVIRNKNDYENTAAGDLDDLGTWAAKYPGDLGNSLKVEICDLNAEGLRITLSTPYVSGDDFTVGETVTQGPVGGPYAGATGTVVKWVPAAEGSAGSVLWVLPASGTFVTTSGQVIANAAETIEYQPSAVTNINLFRSWDYNNLFDGIPGTSDYVAARGGENDELHIVVIDKDGKWSGEAGTVLETFAFVSKAADAKTQGNATNYYVDVVNNGSKYIWWADHTAAGTDWGSDAENTSFAQLPDSGVVSDDLTGGNDGSAVTDNEIVAGWDLFADPETTDIALLVAGPNTTVVAQKLIDIAESRLDCVAFISPERDDVVGVTNLNRIGNVVAFRQSLNISTSYAVMDSGWKYQYDKYNDKFVWVPLNGDIAGLCARTDTVADPWWSPAGFNRGQIRNVVKLAFNPRQIERDELYKNGINPVVSFPGEGTILYGDKTLQSKPSAFDRINVRRLFIVLEKAIAIASKYSLFEFNDEFTRSQFRAMVEPFLRDVQGRRGITDFRVVCDGTNNPPEVVDRNEFVADLYIKPARSINFIRLNFVAVRTGVSFEEVVGFGG